MRRGLLLLLALPRAAGNAYNSSAYAPLDGVVGDRLAQMVGFPSLAALAGPQDLMTSGEVALLVSGNLMLLEALAPHLLWRRRGPLFVDDGPAGSVDLCVPLCAPNWGCGIRSPPARLCARRWCLGPRKPPTSGLSRPTRRCRGGRFCLRTPAEEPGGMTPMSR